MDKTAENVNNTETNTPVSKPVENVEATKKKNENLNGHRNEKLRLKNVLLHVKIKFKRNRKFKNMILRLLPIQIWVQVAQKNIENQNVVV